METGRHGNKGIISNLDRICQNGRPVDMVFNNPLGVPECRTDI
jgi:DNA-directed RNA polymerase beta subunit